jgi:hypothetical protein
MRPAVEGLGQNLVGGRLDESSEVLESFDHLADVVGQRGRRWPGLRPILGSEPPARPSP